MTLANPYFLSSFTLVPANTLIDTDLLTFLCVSLQLSAHLGTSSIRRPRTGNGAFRWNFYNNGNDTRLHVPGKLQRFHRGRSTGKIDTIDFLSARFCFHFFRPSPHPPSPLSFCIFFVFGVIVFRILCANWIPSTEHSLYRSSVFHCFFFYSRFVFVSSSSIYTFTVWPGGGTEE